MLIINLLSKTYCPFLKCKKKQKKNKTGLKILTPVKSPVRNFIILHAPCFVRLFWTEVDREAILHEKRQHNNRAQRKREWDTVREENVEDNYSRAKLSLWNLLCIYEVSLTICPAFSARGPAPFFSLQREPHTRIQTQRHTYEPSRKRMLRLDLRALATGFLIINSRMIREARSEIISQHTCSSLSRKDGSCARQRSLRNGRRIHPSIAADGCPRKARLSVWTGPGRLSWRKWHGRWKRWRQTYKLKH